MRGCREIGAVGAIVGVIFSADVAPATTDFGRGKLITRDDLAGKKFCWDSGYSVVYGTDGRETNNRNNHHPPWSVPEPGVLRYWGNRLTSVEILPDGTLHFYRYCLFCGDHDNDSWARPCA
jgi:hypothetical protein